MSLTELGWNPFFARHFDGLKSDKLEPARVFREEPGLLVRTESATVSAIPTGNLRKRLSEGNGSLVVGDWVAVERGAEGTDHRIHHILPRVSVFKRKRAGGVTRHQDVAANIDIVFLVSGLDGDFNLRRIERYVTQAWNSGAKPVLLLNKADICDDVDGRILAAESAAPGVDVHAVSAQDQPGLESIRAYIEPGVTVAFLGSSGVGKSTLANRLIGIDLIRTQSVREDDSRGRHTTTRREMLELPGGGLLIDTPGMRELQLWSSHDDLDQTFSDISELAVQCRFRDCTHTSEPGCAVLEALEDGSLDEARYRSHQKLEKELAYLERRQDEASAFAQRRHDRELTKMYRRVMRAKKGKRGSDD